MNAFDALASLETETAKVEAVVINVDSISTAKDSPLWGWLNDTPDSAVIRSSEEGDFTLRGEELASWLAETAKKLIVKQRKELMASLDSEHDGCVDQWLQSSTRDGVNVVDLWDKVKGLRVNDKPLHDFPAFDRSNEGEAFRDQFAQMFLSFNTSTTRAGAAEENDISTKHPAFSTVFKAAKRNMESGGLSLKKGKPETTRTSRAAQRIRQLIRNS